MRLLWALFVLVAVSFSSKLPSAACPQMCSGFGSCRAGPSGNPYCDCYYGFSGDDCSARWTTSIPISSSPPVIVLPTVVSSETSPALVVDTVAPVATGLPAVSGLDPGIPGEVRGLRVAVTVGNPFLVWTSCVSVFLNFLLVMCLFCQCRRRRRVGKRRHQSPQELVDWARLEAERRPPVSPPAPPVHAVVPVVPAVPSLPPVVLPPMV